MSDWDIDPKGVRTAVTKTIDVGDDFEKHAKTYRTNMLSSAKQSGSSIVSTALSDFHDHHKDAFSFMVKRTVNTLTAAVDATKAYLDGDLEMAQNAQDNAWDPTKEPTR